MKALGRRPPAFFVSSKPFLKHEARVVDMTALSLVIIHYLNELL